MIKEYKKENKIEYVVPNCPRCGRQTRMHEFNVETSFTVISLMAVCKNGCGSFRPSDEDVAVISTYPLNGIFFIDSKGKAVS